MEIGEDREMALQIANAIWNSLKGRPVLGRIHLGKEPPQFIALFQPMVILKGGISSGYKKFVEEKGLTDETYSGDGIALVRVSGTSIHNNKTLQVDAVSTSLSSTDCFVLQSGNSMFTWIGNGSSYEQQQWAAKVAEFLKPGAAVKHCKEGTESSAFWFALGGKQNYTNRNVTQDAVVRDPHLYTFSFRNGKLEVTEIFNFAQDDLLTEDMMILDTHTEVFVWMGQCVDTKEKHKALEIGQKYVEHAVTFEGLSPDVSLYKVIEGNEPCFFRTYFSWDNTRSVIHGNSFQKKLSLLFGMRSESGSKSSGDGGPTQRASALAALSSAFNPSSLGKQSNDRPRSSGDGGPTQRASAMAALSSAFNPSSKPKSPQPSSHSGQDSQRAAAVSALSNVLTAEGSSRSPRINRSSPTAVDADAEKTELAPSDASPQSEAAGSSEFYTDKDAPGDGVSSEGDRTEPDVSQEQTANENGGETTFSYDCLISKSTDPVRGNKLVEHPVAQALSSVVSEQKISKHWLKRSVEARINDANRDEYAIPEITAELEKYAEDTQSTILYMTLQSGGIQSTIADHAASHIGKASGLLLLLKSLPHHVNKQGTIPYIPASVAEECGLLTKEGGRSEVRMGDELPDAVFKVASVADAHLQKARELASSVPAEAVPVLLPAVPAQVLLDSLRRCQFNVFDSRLSRGVHGISPLWYQLKLNWRAWRSKH